MANAQIQTSEGTPRAPTRIAQNSTNETRRTMLIGQLARLSGRSIHTIRWYESQRLMPGVRRDIQGRRVYADGHIEWLQFLERLRDSGMSIREMREYTALAKRGVASVQDRLELLQAHRRRIESTIADLAESLELIDAKIAFYDEWRRTGARPPPPRKWEQPSTRRSA